MSNNCQKTSITLPDAVATGTGALGVPIAAGLLCPVTGLALQPMIAAAAMSLSSVSAISNALRLPGSRT